MARIRTIKPTFFRHEGLYEAEQETDLPLRLAFAGLWTACDREGRFVWQPRTLKLDCLPHDDVDFSRVLDALMTRGWIVRYAVQGKTYGHIPSWKLHQVINNREAASEIPEPNENNTLTREPRVPDASPTPLVQDQGEGKGREQEGKGEDTASAVSSSAASYVFESGIVRLTEKGFRDWEIAFPRLDLRAELTGLSEWANLQGADRWFFALSGALAKRNRELRVALDKPRRTAADQDWKEALQ